MKYTILDNLSYTELAYQRVNKKLGLSLNKIQIEKYIFEAIYDTESEIYKKGKNYYITNLSKRLRITVNSSTYRIITVDILKVHDKE